MSSRAPAPENLRWAVSRAEAPNYHNRHDGSMDDKDMADRNAEEEAERMEAEAKKKATEKSAPAAR